MPETETEIRSALERAVGAFESMNWTAVPSFLSLSGSDSRAYREELLDFASTHGGANLKLLVASMDMEDQSGGVRSFKFFVYSEGSAGGRAYSYSLLDGVTRFDFMGFYDWVDFNQCETRFGCYCHDLLDEDDDNFSDECAICDWGTDMACRTHSTVH